MINEKSTVVTEVVMNEEKTDRYMYKRVWSRAKTPKLACVLTIHPGITDPNLMDLTTMLISNAIYDLEFDGFISVNLNSRLTDKRHISKEDFSEENNQAVLDAMNDENVETIIIGIGSAVLKNKDVNTWLKDILEQLSPERKEICQVLTAKKGPVHPLAPGARGVGGWQLVKLKL